MPKYGDLEVWYIGSLNSKRQSVEDIEEAKRVLTAWADADLKNDNVQYNSMGLERFEEDGRGGYDWCEYYDDMGDDIFAIMKEEKEEN